MPGLPLEQGAQHAGRRGLSLLFREAGSRDRALGPPGGRPLSSLELAGRPLGALDPLVGRPGGEGETQERQPGHLSAPAAAQAAGVPAAEGALRDPGFRCGANAGPR